MPMAGRGGEAIEIRLSGKPGGPRHSEAAAGTRVAGHPVLAALVSLGPTGRGRSGARRDERREGGPRRLAAARDQRLR